MSDSFIDLCEMFRLSGKPRRSVRTASLAEIKQTKANVALCFDLFGSSVDGYLRRLNENMPITETIEYRDLMDALADMKSDMIGRLEAAEDRGEAQ